MPVFFSLIHALLPEGPFGFCDFFFGVFFFFLLLGGDTFSFGRLVFLCLSNTLFSMIPMLGDISFLICWRGSTLFFLFFLSSFFFFFFFCPPL